MLNLLLSSLILSAYAQIGAPQPAQPPAAAPQPPAISSAVVPFKKGAVVSEAVAQAAGHVITSREVVVSHILAQVLNEQSQILKDKKKMSEWILKPGTAEFKQHLAQILLEMVVNKEAENFSIGDVANTEIQNSEKLVNDTVKDWAYWQSLEVTPAELNQLIIVKLRAKNFLKFKSETSGVNITDEEAKTFYDKNRVKFGNLPFAQFKSSIKGVLAQEQLQEKLKDWFDILKRKYRVKVLGGV